MSQQQQPAREKFNVLFICSMNRWRSPTAEKVYRRSPLANVRSAGTSAKAKHRVSYQDLQWADLVIAMEAKHAQRLKADFPGIARHKEMHVLEVEDNYEYMHPALVEELKAAIDPIFDLTFPANFPKPKPVRN